MYQKLIALVLALCLCLGCLPGPIPARAVTEDGGALTDTLSWSLSDTTLTISGTGPMPDYRDNGDAPWADYYAHVTRVVIADGVERVGKRSFEDFWELEQVELGDTVTTIGDRAFYNCNSLRVLQLPASVTEIHPDAIEDSGVEEFLVAKGNETYTAIGGVLFSKDGTVLVRFPTQYPGTEYVIPDHVTGVADFAFADNETLEYLQIPGTVEEMGWNVFYYADQFQTAGPIGSGAQVEFGWETAMPDRALDGLTLFELAIPGSMTYVGDFALPEVHAVFYELDIESWQAIEFGDEPSVDVFYFNCPMTGPEETFPVETTGPVETEPDETEPEETDPDETRPGRPDETEPDETRPDETESDGPTEPEEEPLSFEHLVLDQVTEVVFTEDEDMVFFQFKPERTGRYCFMTLIDGEWEDFLCAVMDRDVNVLAEEVATAEEPNIRVELTLKAGVTYVFGLAELSRVDVPIPIRLSAEHEYQREPIIPATCTTEGLDRGVCTICGDSRELVSPKAHDFSQGPCLYCGAAIYGEGDFGEGLHWSLSGSGVLTISGQGEIPAYDRYTNDWFYYPGGKKLPPWADYCQNIRSLVVEEGITAIGALAFWSCRNLEQVTLPETLSRLHTTCFWECAALKELTFPASLEQFDCSVFVPMPGYSFGGGLGPLESLTFLGQPPKELDTALEDCNEELKLFYKGSQGDWKQRLPGTIRSYDLEQIIRPGDLAFDRTEFSLSAGSILLLEHNADPYTASLLTQWESADPAIARVAQEGYVTGIAPGTTTIHVRSADGTFQASCQVTVQQTVMSDAALVELDFSHGDRLGFHNYTLWDAPGAASIHPNEDGSWDLLQISEEESGLIITRFDAEWKQLWSKTVSADEIIPADQTIPENTLIYGGSFDGSSYNFLLFGMYNPEESDSQEVLRLVRYDKDWQKLDDCVIYGANTYIPFDAGTVDFAESGGKLYIHTCHEMYETDDGKRHQANMSFVVDQNTMEVVDQWYNVMNLDYGYVSHSFSQKVRATADHVFRVDHGDAHPRAIVLTRMDTDGALTDVVHKRILPIEGYEGANLTGVSLGGFELSGENCLIVGNSVEQTDDYLPQGQRNIFLSVVGQDLTGLRTIWLTNYPSDVLVDDIGTPQLVKLQENTFLLMWEQDKRDDKLEPQTNVVLVSGEGDLLTEIMTLDCRLSDVQPVATADFLVTWFAPDETTTRVYQLNWSQLLTDPERVKEVLGHQYEQTVKEPTCTGYGRTTYRCRFCGDTYEDSRTEPLGHDMGEWELTYHPTCYFEGKLERWCRRDCGYVEYATTPQRIHDYIPVVHAPTCMEGGYTDYTCQYCLESYTDDFTEPAGHEYGEWYVYQEPDCTRNGFERSDCIHCHRYQSREVERLGHDYKAVEYPSTCTERGYILYECANCGDTLSSGKSFPALGHDFGEWTVTKEATEDAEGEEQRSCSRCDETETRVVSRLDHDHSYTAVVTEPDCTEPGFTTYTCHCGESYTADILAPLGHDYAGGICKRCGEADPDYEAPTEPEENPFTDVPAGVWYAEPVLWAVEQGITTGTSTTTFGPNAPCIRAQVVTFLWRAMGEPEPEKTDNPFTDVPEGAYYYKAVLWAVEQGITSGMTPTTFGPNEPCTRAQVVTFLWRAVEQPEPEQTENPFTDVAEGWFYKPVLWAVEKGVTSGMSPDTFAPNGPCTRAQVVTFLHRALKDQ